MFYTDEGTREDFNMSESIKDAHEKKFLLSRTNFINQVI